MHFPDNPKIHQIAGIGLVILLILQLLMCLHFGHSKIGFHEDEIATYELSNSPNGLWRDWNINQWKSGEEYQNDIVLSEENTFSYGMVYENQEKDVHPPLYYFLIHTISSFIPGIFSKWIGLAPNIIFALMTTLVVYRLSMNLSRNHMVSLITAAFYAFSVGTFSTVMFIRMYTILTFFCALLALIHVRLVYNLSEGKEIAKKDCLFLLVCTALGILTQYYFMIYCFFLCGCFALGLLLLNKKKRLFMYLGAEFGAIVLSVAVFPRMIYHCLGGYRGKEAFANAVDSEKTIENIEKAMSIISKQVANGWIWELGKIIIFAVFLLLINYYFFHFKVSFDKESLTARLEVNLHLRRKSSWTISVDGLVYLILSIVILGYILVIAKIAPYQTDRYYMCVYPLIYIIIAHSIFGVLQRFGRTKISLSILSLLLLFICVSGHINQNINYVNKNYEQREKLDEYRNLPVIVLNGAYNWYADHWIYEYSKNPAVFRSEGYCDLSIITEAVESQDLSNGFLIYSCRLNMSEKELFNELNQYTTIESHKKIVSAGDPVYLCYIP